MREFALTSCISSFSHTLDFHPPKHSLPFLPKTPKCLKTGQLAKVIAKTGRVVVGRIRYCGPVAADDADETYVGLQLPSALGDCDGSSGGRKFFEWWVCLLQRERFIRKENYISFLSSLSLPNTVRKTSECLCHSRKLLWHGIHKFEILIRPRTGSACGVSWLYGLRFLEEEKSFLGLMLTLLDGLWKTLTWLSCEQTEWHNQY